MRGFVVPRLMGIAALFTMTWALQATIVDRVAIAVGNKVITQSEIEERIRLTAFQNREKPDFSPASRKQAAERLIDQKLIEREMDVGHFPRGDAERGKQLLADYEASSYPAGNEAGNAASHASMISALTTDGLTADDLETDLPFRWTMRKYENISRRRFRRAPRRNSLDWAECVRRSS